MTQPQNTRRFYIDHGDDQPVVRTVPVRRVAPPASIPEAPESVATRQVPDTADQPPAPSLADKARRAPRNVSRLVKTARKRSHS